MSTQRPGDDRWSHAAETVTVDSVEGVRHLVLMTSGMADADFVMTYLRELDAAIAAANRQQP
jgi:hypothetical protein